MKLNTLDHLPTNFFDWDARAFARELVHPTLVTLKGSEQRPLFISVLLHGNETSGFYIVQNLLRSLTELPRTLMIFFGNLPAVREGVRSLQGQSDFNRIWSQGESPEHRLARDVLAQVAQERVWASVDIHNNTGKNPYYACLNKTRNDFLYLASMFSSEVVYFVKPHEVLSMAFSKICPSVTLECGQPDEAKGIAHTMRFLQELLTLKDLDRKREREIKLLSTVARLAIRDSAAVSFARPSSPNSTETLFLRDDLDELNFKAIAKGEKLGHTTSADALSIVDNEGHDVTKKYIDWVNGDILCKREIFPSMLTKNVDVAKQDCLGYLMEEISLEGKN